MNNSKLMTRLILLLGAAGWRPDEVVEVISEIKASRFRLSEVDEMLSEVRNFRTYFLKSSRHYYTSDVYRIDPIKPFNSEVSDTADKVERLLRIEAGMTNEVAVRLVSRELKRLDPSRAEEIPPYSKKSLVSWVDRLSKVYPPSEILHVATLLRNKHVHGVEPDWKLRKD